MSGAPALATEHLFDYEALLEPALVVGRGPLGHRTFHAARGGRVEGPRLSGEILPGGGDWALTGEDGWTRLDVRGQCRTDDGAVLYLRYHGLLEPTPAVARALAGGGETAFEDQYFRIALEVETGDERYAWLARSALVGRGRISAGPGVAYQVFRLV